MKQSEVIVGNWYRYKGGGASGYGQCSSRESLEGEKYYKIQDVRGYMVYQRACGLEYPGARLEQKHGSFDYHDILWWQEFPYLAINLEDRLEREQFITSRPGLIFPVSTFTSLEGSGGDYIRFQNIMEAWMVSVWEKFSIPWQYEPQEFTLLDSSVCVPDFYLSELDLYIELTGGTKKAKTAKMAQLRAAKPGIQIICLHRRALKPLYHELATGAMDRAGLVAYLENILLKG